MGGAHVHIKAVKVTVFHLLGDNLELKQVTVWLLPDSLHIQQVRGYGAAATPKPGHEGHLLLRPGNEVI